MINPRYKDRLFCLLFGDERYRENIISLYNALCNTNYSIKDEMLVYTIDDVIYIKMKNDVSVLLDSYLSLWEQQSTFNPNMPIRGLMYYGKLYSKYITEHELKLYGSKLIQIPTPRYTVFYNGEKELLGTMELKLSDAFQKPDSSGKYEWTALLINLNDNKNSQLLNRCQTLKGYTTLIDRIKGNKRRMEIENAVNEAVNYCITNDILRDFLLRHKAEVLDMCITEFDEQKFIRDTKEEGREAGAMDTAVRMIDKGKLPLDEIAEYSGLSIEKVKELAAHKA